MSDKAGKEFQFGLTPLFSLGGGKGRDIYKETWNGRKKLKIAVKQMERKWKRELEDRDAKLREELKNRDMTFCDETTKNAESLCKMLERRDQEMMVVLHNRDKLWSGSFENYKQSYIMMTYEKVNNRTSLESIGKRQCEFVKINVEILD